MKTTIKDPTTKKVLNRGWTPIRYHYETGSPTNPHRSKHVYGWIIEMLPKGGALVQLNGQDKPRKLTAADMQYVTVLTPPKEPKK